MCNALDVAHCALYMWVVPTLSEQLRAAARSKGWTMDKLLRESGLRCVRSSLNRKLNGLQKLSTEECEALASVLGVTVAFTPEPRARTRRRS